MPRGSKPGERRGGRQKGGLNKVGQDIRLLAAVYTSDALTTLAHIMEHSETDNARVAAARELLDRAHGKPAQYIEANIGLLDQLSDAEQRSLAAALATLAGESGADADGAASTYH